MIWTDNEKNAPNHLEKMKKQRKTSRFNEIDNHALQKESEDGEDDNDQKIYASMACMSGS